MPELLPAGQVQEACGRCKLGTEAGKHGLQRSPQRAPRQLSPFPSRELQERAPRPLGQRPLAAAVRRRGRRRWPGPPAAARERQLSRLLYLVEHLLAVVFNHLRLCLPPPSLGGLANGAAHGGALLLPTAAGPGDGELSLATLGSERVRAVLGPLWTSLQTMFSCLRAKLAPPASLLHLPSRQELSIHCRHVPRYVVQVPPSQLSLTPLSWTPNPKSQPHLRTWTSCGGCWSRR